MPSKITLLSVIILYSVHIVRLYPKYIKNHKKLLVILYLSLLLGVNYHYTSKYLILDVLIVMLNLYYHNKYFPKITKYIYVIIIFTVIARLINCKYGNNISQSICTLIIHLMGHLIFIYSYNQLE